MKGEKYISPKEFGPVTKIKQTYLAGGARREVTLPTAYAAMAVIEYHSKKYEKRQKKIYHPIVIVEEIHSSTNSAQNELERIILLLQDPRVPNIEVPILNFGDNHAYYVHLVKRDNQIFLGYFDSRSMHLHVSKDVMSTVHLRKKNVGWQSSSTECHIFTLTFAKFMAQHPDSADFVISPERKTFTDLLTSTQGALPYVDEEILGLLEEADDNGTKGKAYFDKKTTKYTYQHRYQTGEEALWTGRMRHFSDKYLGVAERTAQDIARDPDLGRALSQKYDSRNCDYGFLMGLVSEQELGMERAVYKPS